MNLERIYRQLKSYYESQGVDVSEEQLRQMAWMKRDRMIFENSTSSAAGAGAGAGAGGGGETILRRKFRNQKYLASQGNYSDGITVASYDPNEDNYVKIFLPYVGDLRFFRKLTEVSSLFGGENFEVSYNFQTGKWDRKLDGFNFGSTDELYNTTVDLGLGETLSIYKGDISNSLCLSMEGNTPSGLTQVTMFGQFGSVSDTLAFLYIGSVLDSGSPEIAIINAQAIDGSASNDEWTLILAGTDSLLPSGDDSFASLTNSVTPAGTYSVTLIGSAGYDGTFSVRLGNC